MILGHSVLELSEYLIVKINIYISYYASYVDKYVYMFIVYLYSIHIN